MLCELPACTLGAQNKYWGKLCIYDPYDLGGGGKSLFLLSRRVAAGSGVGGWSVGGTLSSSQKSIPMPQCSDRDTGLWEKSSFG